MSKAAQPRRDLSQDSPSLEVSDKERKDVGCSTFSRFQLVTLASQARPASQAKKRLHISQQRRINLPMRLSVVPGEAGTEASTLRADYLQAFRWMLMARLLEV